MRRLGAMVRNAERMMIQAMATKDGIEFTFADGCKGSVPYSDALGGRKASLVSIDLSSPFKADLQVSSGEPIELPWDFVRHYCDPSYEQKVAAISALGRQSLGARIRAFREAAGMTQSMLAEAAGIGRVTETRIEKGEQSPRYENLLAIARSLNRSVSDLIAPATSVFPSETSAMAVRETQKPLLGSSDVQGEDGPGPTNVRVSRSKRSKSGQD